MPIIDPNIPDSSIQGMPVISPVSVKGKIAAKGVIVPNLTLTRYNYCDPGPGDAGLIVNESGVTYQGAGHVGDGVELSSGYTANGYKPRFLNRARGMVLLRSL